jgi:thiol:disulfide interchange protein DsbD
LARLRAVLLALAVVVPALAADQIVTGRLTTTPTEVVADITIAPGWHVNAAQPKDRFLIPTSLTLVAPAGTTVGAVRYPDAVDRVLPFSAGKPMALYEGTVRMMALLTGPADGLRGTLRYQACDDTHCLPPRTLDLSVARRDAAAAAGDDVAAFVDRWGWGLTFLWVAVLGAALNLTPCVYPLISVTVAFFGGRTGEERGSVGRALCYVLGICLTFSALGVAAALTGSVFGAALQRPAVLGGIVVLMVALALSNFGLWQVRMPQGVMQFAGRAGEGALGALFMGLTMGIVAAPCIGPIVVGLLLFVGARQSVPLGFALFFALGVGLGAPYVALALAAGRLRRLPRGGEWLGWMERLFGVLLLGLALHFATPLLPPAWLPIAWAALLVGGGVGLGLVWPPASGALRSLARLAGVGAIAVGLGGVFVEPPAPPIAWQPFSEAALVEARADGRPVLIDFEATWCLPCREMDRTTLRDPAVVEHAGEFVTLKADVTEENEVTSALMQRFRVPGVPTYVFLGPDGVERQRLVGFVPAPRMLEALREAARDGDPGRG